eukprot:scaffold2991_cov120-Isochrysis_galbana.AAC.3
MPRIYPAAGPGGARQRAWAAQLCKSDVCVSFSPTCSPHSEVVFWDTLTVAAVSACRHGAGLRILPSPSVDPAPGFLLARSWLPAMALVCPCVQRAPGAWCMVYVVVG